MVTLKIGSERVTLPTKWSEVTIADMQRVYEACPLPDDVRKAWAGEVEPAELPVEFYTKTLPGFEGDFMAALGGFDKRLIRTVLHTDRMYLFDKYFQKFALALYAGVIDYEPKGEETYIVDDLALVAPLGRLVLNQRVPFYKTSVRQFSEIADIMTIIGKLQKDWILNAHTLIGVALREDGKDYNEEFALWLAERAKGWTMDKFWEVFFSWAIALACCPLYTQGVSVVEEKEEKEGKARPFGKVWQLWHRIQQPLTIWN